MNLMAVARRVLAEFEEMPELTLTPRQASRFFGLSERDCHIVLDILVHAECLRHTGSGKLTLGERAASRVAA
jgi:hypothetical protein